MKQPPTDHEITMGWLWSNYKTQYEVMRVAVKIKMIEFWVWDLFSEWSEE